MPRDGTDSSLVARAAARAASEKQGERTVILDVRNLIVITDYFVVTSGSSERQVRTIAEEIQKSLAESGARAVRREGESEGKWVLIDYVDIVVHVFGEEERDFYDLERLWRDAPRLDWEPSGAASSV
ncbi:MAG: ribosome silencing factor [Actinomycetota bacterium]